MKWRIRSFDPCNPKCIFILYILPLSAQFFILLVIMLCPTLTLSSLGGGFDCLIMIHTTLNREETGGEINWIGYGSFIISKSINGTFSKETDDIFKRSQNNQHILLTILLSVTNIWSLNISKSYLIQVQFLLQGIGIDTLALLSQFAIFYADEGPILCCIWLVQEESLLLKVLI